MEQQVCALRYEFVLRGTGSQRDFDTFFPDFLRNPAKASGDKLGGVAACERGIQARGDDLFQGCQERERRDIRGNGGKQVAEPV